MKKNKTIFLALIVMLLWGSLFPFVKLAYSAFQIDSGKPANLLLFAGVRFLICGGCISAYCFARSKEVIALTWNKKQWSTIFLTIRSGDQISFKISRESQTQNTTTYTVLSSDLNQVV